MLNLVCFYRLQIPYVLHTQLAYLPVNVYEYLDEVNLEVTQKILKKGLALQKTLQKEDILIKIIYNDNNNNNHKQWHIRISNNTILTLSELCPNNHIFINSEP